MHKLTHIHTKTHRHTHRHTHTHTHTHVGRVDLRTQWVRGLYVHHVKVESGVTGRVQPCSFVATTALFMTSCTGSGNLLLRFMFSLVLLLFRFACWQVRDMNNNSKSVTNTRPTKTCWTRQKTTEKTWCKPLALRSAYGVSRQIMHWGNADVEVQVHSGETPDILWLVNDDEVMINVLGCRLTY